MRIALITDTHWGVRNDNMVFLDANKKFLDETFFPTLESNSINHIVHLGDIVDRRKQISYLTANRLREDFLDKILQKGMTADIIAGNHDCYYKNTNKVNALTELIDSSYPNIKCYIDPTEVNLFGAPTLYLPWICEENREQSMRMINETKSIICMGHLQILGFEMFRGSIATHGEDRNIFDKFAITMSGHFHHKSTIGSICYLGSHSEFTWSDYNDPRGFHIFDTETQDLKFISNPYRIFKKIWYDDREKELEELLNFDPNQYNKTMLKIIVTSKTNPYWFDLFCNKIEKSEPINMQIVEDHFNITANDEAVTEQAESTLDIFKEYISNMNHSNLNKNKLENVIIDLYNEAQLVA